MRDREGNAISLTDRPNPHIVVYGQSGQGKTYFCCRRVEEAVEKGKEILILDYSGSYTHTQLAENQAVFADSMLSFNLAKKPFVWTTCFRDIGTFSTNVSETLATVLGVGGYFQKKWLDKAVSQYLWDSHVFRFDKFVEKLEAIYMEERNGGGRCDDADNIKRLLSRLSPFSKMGNFMLVNAMAAPKPRKQVTIVQMSYLSVRERRFVSAMITELFWKEVMASDKRPRYQMILFDEFQFLPLGDGSCLENMLREGRKYKMEVLLSTQFVSHYKKDALETLMQAGHVVIFRPSPTDVEFSLHIIGNVDKGAWRELLNGLGRGEAVIKGSFYIGDGSSGLVDMPVICRV